MQQHRALILRSNRFLGSAFVDKGLITVGDLEAANERLVEAIQNAELKRASILSSLLYDLKAVEESKLIEHVVEEHGIGLVDLGQCNLRSARDLNFDITLCWATSTIPFDKVEDHYFVATCYYLSTPVVKKWTEMLGNKVIWFATTNTAMTQALERLEEMESAEAAEEEAEKAEAQAQAVRDAEREQVKHGS
jgi:hypothetical protein